MIKKLIALLFVGILSMAAFAGEINPYIEVENYGTGFAPYYTIGAKTADAIGTSKWTFTADGSLYDEKLLTLQSPLQFDLGITLGWQDALELLNGDKVPYGYTFLVDETLIFQTGANLLVNTFEPSFGLEGFFGPIKAWVELAFPYANWAWGFEPTIGFSIGK